MASEFVDLRGVRLHVLSSGGGGRPVVLVHGNSHCAGIWEPIATVLVEGGLAPVAVDLRGHGASDKLRDGYDWASLRDDLTGLLERLDLRDVLLVGHSRGGGASLLAAAAARDRVAGALVYEPTLPAFAASIPAGARARLVERALNRRSVFPSRTAALEHYRGRDAFRLWDENVLRAYVEHGTAERPDSTVELRCPPWVEATLYEAMLDPAAWEGLSCPELPVLAVYGEQGGRVGEGRDPTTPLRPSFPRVAMQVMPGATHFGPMEQPATFARMICGFAATLP